jgi:16S rRNA (guanine527-N7)-methyltransferase
VLAIRRPDLRVTLVEPLLRRTTFLEEAVAALELDQVEVYRGRADALHGQRTFDVVTSRAVAPLDRLSEWSLPLVRSGGLFLAMKGSSVQAELDSAARAIAAGRGVLDQVVELGAEFLDHPVRVVRIVKE